MRRPSLSSRSRAVLRALVAQGLSALCLPALLAAQAAPPSPPRIDAVMSTSDIRETGVSRLSGAERAALERWLGRYTTVVATAARSTPSQARPSTAERPSQREYGERTRATVRHSRLRSLRYGDLVEVRGILGGGAFIVLTDGTMWEVWVGDQSNSVTWDVGDRLLVRQAPAPPEQYYDWKFENGRARSIVTVRYAGIARPAAVEIGKPTKSDSVAGSSTSSSSAPASSATIFAPSAAYETVYEPVYGAYYYLPQWDARRGNAHRTKRGDFRAIAPKERTIGVRPSTGSTASPAVGRAPAAARAASPGTSAPRQSTAPGLSPVPTMTAAPRP